MQRAPLHQRNRHTRRASAGEVPTTVALFNPRSRHVRRGEPSASRRAQGQQIRVAV